MAGADPLLAKVSHCCSCEKCNEIVVDALDMINYVQFRNVYGENRVNEESTNAEMRT